MSKSDLELLREYRQQSSEPAFAELVRRHLDLVYSAALRQVNSPQLAEEVTQEVFAKLVQAADKLRPDTILPAWLYKVTRSAAVSVVRHEARRQSRERAALEIADMKAEPSEWSRVEPLLDEAMDALEEADRTALLLRFFQNKSLREVGQTLGTSEDAAQKRVSRAIGRLQAFFTSRGIAVTGTTVIALLSTQAMQSAPAGLAAAVCSAATLSAAAIHSSGTIAVAKALTMTTLQKTLITATVAAVVGAGVYQERRVSHLREQLQSLQQEQQPLRDRLEQLRRERDEAAQGLALARQELEQVRRDTAAVPRLRGEVARLKDNAKAVHEPATQSALSWAARVESLKQRLEEMPDKKIPELQLCTERDWLDAAKDARLDTEAGVRQALKGLRNCAKNHFAQMMGKALDKYVKEHDQQYPTDLAQLKPYFNPPVEDAMLERYHLVFTGKANELPEGHWPIIEKAPVDPDYDTRHEIGIGGYSVYGVDETSAVLEALIQAAKDYARDHNGQRPTELSQVRPYIRQPVDEAALQKLISSRGIQAQQ